MYGSLLSNQFSGILYFYLIDYILVQSTLDSFKIYINILVFTEFSKKLQPKDSRIKL